jgi:hypothetical protein
MTFEEMEHELRQRLDALGPAPRAELLASRPSRFRPRRPDRRVLRGNPKTRTFAELLIDAEEDPYVRAMLVGMLREVVEVLSADHPGPTATGWPPRWQPGRAQGSDLHARRLRVDIGEKKTQIIVQERRFTTSYLKNVQSEVVVFQINDKDSKAGGGSCFGDSGGAVFLGDYVLGDASYVNSFSCNATGSYQRTDTLYSRAFLNSFLVP